jgi:DNA-binding MarR family transcriptional regulator
MKLSPSQHSLLKSIHFHNKTYIKYLNVNKQIIKNQLPELEKRGLICVGGDYSVKWVQVTELGRKYLQNT